MNLTYKQKEELAKNYLASKQINFGSQEANDRAIEIYIAGVDHEEEIYNKLRKEFIETYKWLFKFHCEELLKEWKKTIIPTNAD